MSGVIINKKKLEHIKFLAGYVRAAYKVFFDNLFAAQDGVDVAGEVDADDVDPTDDVLEY